MSDETGMLRLALEVVGQAIIDSDSPRPTMRKKDGKAKKSMSPSAFKIALAQWESERDDARDFLTRRLYEEGNLWGEILKEYERLHRKGRWGEGYRRVAD